MSMKIGSTVVERGSKGYGFLKVSNTPSGTPLGIRFFIINGSEPGPILCVGAGVHAIEVTGPIAIMRVGKSIDPKKLKGTLIGVPVINAQSFDSVSASNPFPPRFSPIDQIDMNRVYPGQPYAYGKSPPFSHRLAYAYFNEIVVKANYLIDFHSHVNGTPHLTTVIPNVPKVEAKCKELGIMFGLATLQVGGIGLPARGTLKDEAALLGIPAISAEVGTPVDWYQNAEHYVGLAERGTLNVMKHLGMIEGKPELPKKQLVVGDHKMLDFNSSGLYFPAAKERTVLRKGDLIGTLLDPLTGEELERLTAPFDDCFLETNIVFPIVQAGTWPHVRIGRIVETIER